MNKPKLSKEKNHKKKQDTKLLSVIKGLDTKALKVIKALDSRTLGVLKKIDSKTLKKTNGKPKKIKKVSDFNSSQNTLKHLTVGLEAEYFILNSHGKIVNDADKILRKLEKDKSNEDITKEAGKNMIEVGCYPEKKGIDTSQSLLHNLETLLYVAEKKGLIICPLGTYPGEFNPKVRNTGHYRYEKKVFGKNIYKTISRCCGTHIHYSLPWGVFDFDKLKLKKLINSKNKQSLINSYNFMLAIDPAISTFAQSSPFYQGKFIGKDARALVWRGDKDLNFTPSLYNNFPKFGQLPVYQHTGTDLIHLTENMHKEWNEILNKNNIPKKELVPYKSILSTNWTPLRINKLGTLEQRGMDTNMPLIVLAISKLIQNTLKIIQEEFIQIEVSDRAINEPFKYENKKILIPPFSYLKKKMQKLSFYNGLKSDIIFNYCKKLLSLAKKFDYSKDQSIFEPLEKMLENKRTISDEIINEVQKIGYKDFNKPLPNKIAAEVALVYSSHLFKEMVLFRELAKRQGNS